MTYNGHTAGAGGFAMPATKNSLNPTRQNQANTALFLAVTRLGALRASDSPHDQGDISAAWKCVLENLQAGSNINAFEQIKFLNKEVTPSAPIFMYNPHWTKDELDVLAAYGANFALPNKFGETLALAMKRAGNELGCKRVALHLQHPTRTVEAAGATVEQPLMPTTRAR